MATYKPKKKIDNNGTLEDVKIPIESVDGLSGILDTIPSGSPIIDLGTITENPESLTNSVLNANKTSGLYTFKYGGTNYIMACYQSGPHGGRQNITYYSSSTQYNITRHWDAHGFYSVTKKEVAYSDSIPTTTSQLTNNSDFATNSSVDTKIANLVNSAPETLDTLGELATALETHEDAYDALLETVGGKANASDVQDEFEKKGVHFISDIDIKGSNGTSTISRKWEISSVDGITEPFDGMAVLIRLDYHEANSNTGTALSIDDGKTFYPIIFNYNHKFYTQYKSYQIVLIVFDSKVNGTIYLESGTPTQVKGSWTVSDYSEDLYVYQRLRSNNAEHPVLIKDSSSTSSSTTSDAVAFTKNVAINPQTGVLSATAFKENGVALEEKYALKDEVGGNCFENLGNIDTWMDIPYDIEVADIEGVSWNEAYVFQDKDGKIIASGDMAHRIPLQAGEGIELEPDHENNVVKINATSSGGGTPLVEITYNELKALRDDGKLVAGQYYCITDYECTTSQKDTRATASTNFDIIVQALSNSILSENASARPRGEKPTLMKSVLTNKQVKSRVIIYYREYIDYDLDAGLDADYRSGKDYFVDFDYIENNVGDTVPVIYKTDARGLDPTMANYNSEFDGPDYADSFFYEGSVEINGETYDKWRLINEDEDIFTWDSTAKSYVYTNQIVDNGSITIEPFLYEVETDEYRLDSSAVNVSYFEFIDYADGQYDLQPIEDKKFATFEYMADHNGNIVPVLHDWVFDGDMVGDNENYYYEGKATIDGTLYDKWRKIELDTDDFGWDTPSKAYYYTNVIVEATSSNSDIKCQSWEIKYSLDNDKTRFLWADEINGKGVIYYMKDEWNNECPYDFKNIQFKREDICYYTFSWVDENNAVKDSSIVGNTELYNDEGQISGCYGNKMGIMSPTEYSANTNKLAIALNNNIFISTYSYEDGCFYGCYGNTFGDDCNDNTFGDYCNGNTFGNGCFSNTFGNGGLSNTFGNNCFLNTFGNDCYNNTFGNRCYYNTFGDDCQANIVDDGVTNAKPQPTTGEQPMQGVHIHYGVAGQFTVVRGAKYTQDVRTANDVTITV